MIFVPETFRFDLESGVAASLLEDALDVVNFAIDSLEGSGVDYYHSEVSDLLMPDSGQQIKHLDRDVFRQSAAVTLLAFRDSDLDTEVASRTLEIYGNQPMIPFALVEAAPADALDVMETIALLGHNAHPEMAEGCASIQDLFTNLVDCPDVGRIAFCGTGFTMLRLDQAWSRAREVGIDIEIAASVAGLDWDAFPR